MDDGFDDISFLNDQSYSDCIKNLIFVPSSHAYEEEDTTCELAEFDSVLNSKGERVLVHHDTTNLTSKNFRANNRNFGNSAISRTTYWDESGEKKGTKTYIRSHSMKAALKQVVPMYRDRNIKFNDLSFEGKPEHLFHFRNALYDYAQNQPEGSLARRHVTLLFLYLNQELADAVGAYAAHVELAPYENLPPSIDFPHLWTIFKQGQLIYFVDTITDDGAGLLAKFKSATCTCTCKDSFHRFNHTWEVEGDFIDSNGKSLGLRQISAKVSYFDGLCNLAQLPVLPLCFHPREEFITSKLAARGRKYVQLQGRNHRHYKGVARVLSSGGVLGVNGSSKSRFTWIDGRIMTDEETFSKYIPFNIQTPIPFTSSLTDEEYLICRSHVRAFSFTEAKWGYFDVDLIEPIEFDTTVFKSSLMLEDKYKNMLLSLVRMQEADSKLSFKDVIGGKGQGLVFLLHGKPGAGKTMTAESLADCCKRPLLRIDEDGLTSAKKGFEAALSKVLQLAHSWRAIALLDEADLFLEERSQSFNWKNSFATAFLRILEYHHGVLFLTTNRINSFDRAFKSRIQVAIYYPPLSQQNRQNLWKIFLSRSSRPSTRKEEWEELSGEMALEDLNGRQIRDVVRIAQASAFGDESPITIHHLRDAIDAMRTFEREFEMGRNVPEKPSGCRSRKRPRRELDLGNTDDESIRYVDSDDENVASVDSDDVDSDDVDPELHDAW